MAADADDVLRQTVAELAAEKSCTWAGIFFVEDGELVLGPEAGSPDESRRVRAPVEWRGAKVAELAVDGDVPSERLASIANDIAELCLVGWDTAGEPWEP